MKEIKTKPTIKDIKVLEKAVDVSYRAKNTFIRTKEQAEQMQRTDHGNYVEYAEDKIRGSTKTIARETGHVVGRQGKKTAYAQVKQVIRRKAAPDKARERVMRKYTLPNESAIQRFAQSRAKARLSQMKAAEIKIVQATYKPAEKTAWSITLPNVSGAGPTVKQSVRSGNKTIKGPIKMAQKSIKIAERSAKAGIKTSRATDKTARAAQKAAEAARVGAKAATVSAKTAVKAMVASIKAIIAAVNGLIALLTVGGWMVITIILVIWLAGLLSGSAFGVLFSNEIYDVNSPIMTEIVSQVNEEFAAEIERIQNENPHDTVEMSNNGSSTIVGNWRDILAVYAVKGAANPDNGMEVVTLDEAKVGILKEVLWDMNKIDYWLETIEHEESATTILHINVTSKSHTDMIAEYGFNAQQVKMLNGLMQEEYQQLFMQLISS
ncbi:MAG: hypothetical protein CVU87_01110 [Firmicutes bacterium HGW-Firmicutes-12]|nr:MAG: hypothetical protein CVU87_01110 [Firmicutes bacterium HGW-Firmicutes-12]